MSNFMCPTCGFRGELPHQRPVPDPVTPLTAAEVIEYARQHPTVLTFRNDVWLATLDAVLAHPSDAAGEGGHRTDEPHDCFLMRCAALGRDVRFLTEQLAARATRDETALDVERLAKAESVVRRRLRERDPDSALFMDSVRRHAEDVAAEYARLSEPTDPAEKGARPRYARPSRA